MSSEYILEMRNIVKEFSGVRVLNNVSLQVKEGEIHAICGENGAGKSTLMKILSGFYTVGEYQGEIFVEGKPVTFQNNRQPVEAGIEIIYQELEVIPSMTAAENVFLSNEPTRNGIIDFEKMEIETRAIFERLNVDVNPDVALEELGTGMRQLVVIARALMKDPKILIMDEPSAALTDNEATIMMENVKRLASEGVSIIYITHRLEEVMDIADTVTVLRDGQTISHNSVKNITIQNLIHDMVGRELGDQTVRSEYMASDVVFEVKNLSAIDEWTGKKVIDDLSFIVKRGEILGFSGLMGAGRTETALSIVGALPHARVSGNVYLDGKILSISSPKDAIDLGIYMVTEDRKEKGLIQEMSVKNNMSLAYLDNVSKMTVLDENQIIEDVKHYMDGLSIKAQSIEIDVKHLSGGNQQKVVLAKALLTKPKLLILDEPTRGVDVGAKQEIYQIMNDLRDQGVSIIMISSELPEILAMSDRIIIMNKGRITGNINNDSRATQQTIMSYSTMEVIA